MKVLIVSDTHGSMRTFNEVVAREKDLDLFIHLGDVEDDADYMEKMLDCPTHIIAGNNDFFSRLPREVVIPIGKYRVFLTHGDGYYVRSNTMKLKQAAMARNANIVMYGHTHCPNIELEGSVWAINPGSLSYPRQMGRKASYIIMEIGADGNAEFVLKYV